MYVHQGLELQHALLLLLFVSVCAADVDAFRCEVMT